MSKPSPKALVDQYLALIQSSAAPQDQVKPNPELIAAERGQLENARLEAENDALRDELAREKDLHFVRKVVMVCLFCLIVVWLLVVVAYVGLAGAYGNAPDSANFKFKLSDGVLIAFITSTTVSVIGIFLVAANWLFSAKATKTK